jgi:hypothetical protein
MAYDAVNAAVNASRPAVMMDLSRMWNSPLVPVVTACVTITTVASGHLKTTSSLRAACSQELNRTSGFLHLQQCVSIDLHQLQLRSAELFERCCKWRIAEVVQAKSPQCKCSQTRLDPRPQGAIRRAKKAPRRAGLFVAAVRQ